MNKLKKGFVMIPNALFYDNRVSNDAKVLFCYIKSLSANYRNLRNSNLCLKLGISINTLQKAKKGTLRYWLFSCPQVIKCQQIYLTNA